MVIKLDLTCHRMRISASSEVTAPTWQVRNRIAIESVELTSSGCGYETSRFFRIAVNLGARQEHRVRERGEGRVEGLLPLLLVVPAVDKLQLFLLEALDPAIAA